jgi:Uri superfamily endonuclease
MTMFPSAAGTYVLELRLALDRKIEVGRLGCALFRAGWYYYVGSALGGLHARLARHERVHKPRHWHIDALREHAELTRIYFLESAQRMECATAASIASADGAVHPLAGFGSSDCHCSTHLIAYRNRVRLDLGPGWQQKRLHRLSGASD